MIRNERGIGHLIIIVVLLLGILVGLALIKNTITFRPKAGDTDAPVTASKTSADGVGQAMGGCFGQDANYCAQTYGVGSQCEKGSYCTPPTSYYDRDLGETCRIDNGSDRFAINGGFCKPGLKCDAGTCIALNSKPNRATCNSSDECQSNTCAYQSIFTGANNAAINNNATGFCTTPQSRSSDLQALCQSLPNATFTDNGNGYSICKSACPADRNWNNGECVQYCEWQGKKPLYSDAGWVCQNNPPTYGYITASPNPCSLTNSQSICKSTISWVATNPQNTVTVVVRETGSLFAASPSGTQDAPWIGSEGYNFDVKDGSKTLASVFVKGNIGPDTGGGNSDYVTFSANPNPCILNTLGTCTTYVSWTYHPASGATTIPEIRITIKESPGSLFSIGPSNTNQPASWITAGGDTFEARTGSGTNERLLGSIFVKGVNP